MNIWNKPVPTRPTRPRLLHIFYTIMYQEAHAKLNVFFAMLFLQQRMLVAASKFQHIFRRHCGSIWLPFFARRRTCIWNVSLRNVGHFCNDVVFHWDTVLNIGKEISYWVIVVWGNPACCFVSSTFWATPEATATWHGQKLYFLWWMCPFYTGKAWRPSHWAGLLEAKRFTYVAWCNSLGSSAVA